MNTSRGLHFLDNTLLTSINNIRRNYTMKTQSMSTKKDFSHIKDSYFREKLEKGLIPYEPKEWAINQMDAMEERKVK